MSSKTVKETCERSPGVIVVERSGVGRRRGHGSALKEPKSSLFPRRSHKKSDKKRRPIGGASPRIPTLPRGAALGFSELAVIYFARWAYPLATPSRAANLFRFIYFYFFYPPPFLFLVLLPRGGVTCSRSGSGTARTTVTTFSGLR